MTQLQFHEKDITAQKHSNSWFRQLRFLGALRLTPLLRLDSSTH